MSQIHIISMRFHSSQPLSLTSAPQPKYQPSEPNTIRLVSLEEEDSLFSTAEHFPVKERS